jgi:hypothetical protein
MLHLFFCYIFRDIFDDLKDHYVLHTANKKDMVKKWGKPVQFYYFGKQTTQ